MKLNRKIPHPPPTFQGSHHHPLFRSLHLPFQGYAAFLTPARDAPSLVAFPLKGPVSSAPEPGPWLLLGAPASLHGTETSHITWVRIDKTARPRAILSKEPLSGFPRSSDRLPKMLTLPTPEILLKENPWKEGRERKGERKKKLYTKTHRLERRGFPFRKTNFWKPIQKKCTIQSQMRPLDVPGTHF